MFKLVEIENTKSYDVLTSDTDVKIGMIDQLEDGFYYFVPSKGYGYYSANDLKNIANEVDILNEPWLSELDSFYSDETLSSFEDDDLPF